jgi:glycosyltransferase involved in cell wall biosynthesis
VVDDGSTDETAAVASRHGAEVLSLGINRGLPVGIAAGYRWALERGYEFCGRVDADGQHPPAELARLLAIVLSFGVNRGLRAGIAAGYREASERGYAFCGRVDADGQHPAAELSRLLDLVRSGVCDVAVGSRFVPGDGYPAYRYLPSGPRRFGTALLRRAIERVLGRPFADATSGLYAVNAKALPLLAEPFRTEAPEVEALVRLGVAGLRVDEVPVTMAPRAGGVSKLRGRKAVRVVATVVGTLVAAKLISMRRSS